MKKLSILAVVVCMLSVAATAQAGKSKYAGPIDPAGEIAFTLKTTQSKANILKLRWNALPVTCAGAAETTSGTLSFAVPVRNKAFKARAVIGSSDKPEAEAKIAGQLSGKNASGTISLSGSALPVDSGGTADCSSGRLKWTASR